MFKYSTFLYVAFAVVLTFNIVKAQTVPSEELRYKVIKLTDIKRPTSVKVLPAFNLLIITDGSAEQNEPSLFAYTLDSIKFLKSFITIGDGEHQIYTPGAVQYFTGERFIRMFDINMQRFCEIPINPILKPGAPVPVNRYLGRDCKYPLFQTVPFRV